MNILLVEIINKYSKEDNFHDELEVLIISSD